MSITDVLASLGALGTLWATWAGGRHVLSQAKQVQAQTQTDPAVAANEVMRLTLAETREDVTRLRADRDTDRARIAALEEAQRTDRRLIQEVRAVASGALDTLRGPVAVVIEWVLASDDPQAPHTAARRARDETDRLADRLTD